MIEPVTIDLKILQGASFTKDFIWETRQNDQSPYTPVDLTGCVAKMQIRKMKHPDAELILDLTANEYILISDPENGVVYIDIPASVTEALDFPVGFYDIEIHWPTGTVNRIVDGSVSLDFEVTRG